MRNSIIRWTIYLAALFLFGPLAGAIVGSIRAVDGGASATPLVSAAPAAGIVAGLAALGIALVVGAVAARVLGLGPGMSAAGLVMAWAAWKTGTVDGLVRAAGSGGPLRSLAIEGALFGVLGLLVALILAAVSRHDGHGHATGPRNLVPRPAALPAIATGLFVGGVVAWFLAVSPLKGQAVMAAVGAGVVAAAAARLVEANAPNDRKASMAVLILPLVGLAVLGPLSGLVLSGGGSGGGGGVNGVVAAVYRGTLFPIANITPLDWIAGGLLGIPLGVAWAGSMIEKTPAHA